ncbi:MAG: hypothetical protein PHV42_04650 [Candidatus Pacebacteria bacterium]|nr:hypothetical protein [Candidatus Paceibacterota bacterium]
MIDAYHVFTSVMHELESERQSLVLEAKKRMEKAKVDDIMAKLQSL